MIDIVITRQSPAETGGGVWRVGGTYAATDAYAKVLIGRGDAYAADGSIVDISSSDAGAAPGYFGAVADEASMITLAAANPGSEVYRIDTGTYWKLREAPYSAAENWDELGGAAASLVSVPFSGAGTDVLVWVGEGTLMQCVLTASATGSIVIKDQITAGTGPTVTTLTTTSTPETFLINSGAGATIYGGITLTITGANTGYLLVRGA